MDASSSPQPHCGNPSLQRNPRSSSTCAATSASASRRRPDQGRAAARSRAAWRSGGRRCPRGASVVVYCVHGHEVSQNAAKALGARYLEGGIEAWRERRRRACAQAGRRRHALGHARAAEDRPHRLPLAGAPLRRPRRRVPLRARGGSEAASPGEGRGALRHARRGVLARRRALQLRRVPEGVPAAATRRSTSSRPSCAAPTPAGSTSRRRRPACRRLARPVAHLQGRPSRCWSTAW